MKPFFVRMTLVLMGLMAPAVVLGAPGEHKASDFRNGMTVNFLYDQPLGSVYSADWWGRVVKVNGDWRDVYIETSGKVSSTGIMSFNCKDLNSNIGIIDYGLEWGDANMKTLYIIRPRERTLWKLNRLPVENTPIAPYELYQIVFRRYCKA